MAKEKLSKSTRINQVAMNSKKTSDKKGVFIVMQEMCDKNMDIQIAPLSNIIETKIVKNGAEITIGVSHAVGMDIMNNRDFRGGFILCDGKEFDKLRNQNGNE